MPGDRNGCGGSDHAGGSGGIGSGSQFAGFKGDDMGRIIKLIEGLLECEDGRLVNNLIYNVAFSDRSLVDKIYFTESVLNLRRQEGAGKVKFRYDRERKLLDLSGNDNLGPLLVLRALPIEILDLSHSNTGYGITNLKTLPLRELKLAHSKVSSEHVEALADRPIVRLDLQGTRVDDLSVLGGMPLQVLNIRGLKIKDFNSLSQLVSLQTIFCDLKQVAKVRQAIEGRAVKIEAE